MTNTFLVDKDILLNLSSCYTFRPQTQQELHSLSDSSSQSYYLILLSFSVWQHAFYLHQYEERKLLYYTPRFIIKYNRTLFQPLLVAINFKII